MPERLFATIVAHGLAKETALDTQKIETVSATSGVRRRRRWVPIIDARFQWKYTIIVMLLGTTTGAVMGGLLYGAHRDNTRLLQLGGDTVLLQQIEHGDQIFLLYLVGCIAGLALALCAWGLVVTHRISGPAYLAARYLRELRAGSYPDMRRLRKSDELQELFLALADLCQHLRERDAAVYKAVNDALARVRVAIDDPSQASVALQHAFQVLDDESKIFANAKTARGAVSAAASQQIST